MFINPQGILQFAIAGSFLTRVVAIPVPSAPSPSGTYAWQHLQGGPVHGMDQRHYRETPNESPDRQVRHFFSRKKTKKAPTSSNDSPPRDNTKAPALRNGPEQVSEKLIHDVLVLGRVPRDWSPAQYREFQESFGMYERPVEPRPNPIKFRTAAKKSTSPRDIPLQFMIREKALSINAHWARYEKETLEPVVNTILSDWKASNGGSTSASALKSYLDTVPSKLFWNTAVEIRAVHGKLIE